MKGDSCNSTNLNYKFKTNKFIDQDKMVLANNFRAIIVSMKWQYTDSTSRAYCYYQQNNKSLEPM